MSHVYIIYIFIYQYNATPKCPHVLKWEAQAMAGAFATPQMDHRTFGLNSYLLSPVPQTAWFCWGNRGRRGNREALVLWEDRVVLQQHSQRCSDVTLSSPDRGCLQHQTPKHLQRGKMEGRGSPGGSGQDLGKQAPGISEHEDPLGQDRSERHGSHSPVGFKKMSKCKASAGPGIGLREGRKAILGLVSAHAQLTHPEPTAQCACPIHREPHIAKKMPPFLMGVLPKTVGITFSSKPASVSMRQNHSNAASGHALCTRVSAEDRLKAPGATRGQVRREICTHKLHSGRRQLVI